MSVYSDSISSPLKRRYTNSRNEWTNNEFMLDVLARKSLCAGIQVINTFPYKGCLVISDTNVVTESSQNCSGLI